MRKRDESFEKQNRNFVNNENASLMNDKEIKKKEDFYVFFSLN